MRIWKTQKTLLWLTVPGIDFLVVPEVRVADVSTEPPGVLLALEGGASLEPLDLNEAEFDKADSKGAPFPDAVTNRFGAFLFLSLADGAKLVLAEHVQ